MRFTPRDYQVEAINKGIHFFLREKGNAIEMLPTGSGKSLVIAGIANGLQDPVLIFQPSKEILEQNYLKMRSYGHCPAIFSASAGKKQIAHITFATIGSAINKPELFRQFRHIIVDECHGISAKDDNSMYMRFLEEHPEARLLGLTATPFRLASNSYGSELRFLTRTSPRIFDRVIYFKQIGELFRDGYLARLEYFRTAGIDPALLRPNSTGSDFSEESVRAAMKAGGFELKVVNLVERLLKNGRKSVLVFTRFIEEAQNIVDCMPGTAAIVTGTTPKRERERILTEFKAGVIKVVANVGVLTTGFDYPELDTVLLGRPTMSLGLYYQMVGRAIRPHPSKQSAYIVDMCGNVSRFGHVEDLELRYDFKGRPFIGSGPKQLTNVYLQPHDRVLTKKLCTR